MFGNWKEKYKKASELSEEKTNTIFDLRRENRGLSDMLHRVERELNTLKSKKSAKELETNLKKQLKQIKEIKDVESISMMNNVLYVLTKEIKIKHANKTYNLGKFKIVLNGNDIDIRTLKKKKVLSNNKEIRYHHPHFKERISGENIGKMNYCFGTFQKPLSRISNENIFMRIFMFIKYLNNYNHDNPYMDITRFK